MALIPEKQDLDEYLEVSQVIDYDSQNIQQLANKLSQNVENKIQLAERIYEYSNPKSFV